MHERFNDEFFFACHGKELNALTLTGKESSSPI
jgi:hypothetical protein